MGQTLTPILVAIASSLLTATTAAAQQELPSEWTLCINEGNVYPPDIAADGCTAVIRSGGRQPRELAVAFTNRGLAYRAQGDLDRAISDYDSIMRLRSTIAARRGATRATTIAPSQIIPKRSGSIPITPSL
jgi:hypothetical protein